MKDLWLPLLVLLCIIVIALTGGAKNFQAAGSAASGSAPPVVNPDVVNPPQVPPPGQTIYTPSSSGQGSYISLSFGSIGTNNPNQEYMVLNNSSPTGSAPIDITGWKLHSKWSGATVVIPQSVSLYFVNLQNIAADVYLWPGERAFIITGRSPLGAGMHINICSGYLSQAGFTPGLYTSCPLARDENFSSIPHTPNNENCFNLINSLGSCQIGPVLDNTYSYECQQFIETKLNYQSCVDTHKNDTDFYSPDAWYVYLNRGSTVWQGSQYEDVELLDQSGHVISEIKG